MTGKSHSVGGMIGGLICFSVLQDKGYLLENVSEPLQLLCIYGASMYGSLIPDNDHSWESAPCRDVIGWITWKLIHFTTPIRKFLNKGKLRKKLYKFLYPILEPLDAKHRSWQTHSDLFFGVIVAIAFFLPRFLFNNIDSVLFTLIVEGLLSGVISHLILDALTPEGIWSFALTPIRLIFKGKGDTVKASLSKIHFVPNNSFFSTKGSDSKWEKLCRGIMILCCIAVIIKIVYLWQPYRLVFSF